jgi:hypothetical protein
LQGKYGSVKFVMMFELAAPIQFSVPQIIANRDDYIPVVERGAGGSSRHEMCGLQDGVLENIWR